MGSPCDTHRGTWNWQTVISPELMNHVPLQITICWWSNRLHLDSPTYQLCAVVKSFFAMDCKLLLYSTANFCCSTMKDFSVSIHMHLSAYMYVPADHALPGQMYNKNIGRACSADSIARGDFALKNGEQPRVG